MNTFCHYKSTGYQKQNFNYYIFLKSLRKENYNVSNHFCVSSYSLENNISNVKMKTKNKRIL